MGYMEKKDLKNGYNEYLNADTYDCGTKMDVGLLILDDKESYTFEYPDKEIAIDLLKGAVTFAWNGKTVEGSRSDEFHEEAYCLLASKDTKITVTAHDHAELYVQAVKNDKAYDAVMYTPDMVQVEHKGSHGELLGTMQREIKTFFDLDNAPFSNMVLGEVLNYPGKWSSYPPHHHPQPEVYFYRFDYPQGFGASFANGEIYTSHQNGMTIITSGFHSQTAAPGYAMCYTWGIHHLPQDPWDKTRIDDEEHEWLWKDDANEHIYKGK